MKVCSECGNPPKKYLTKGKCGACYSREWVKTNPQKRKTTLIKRKLKEQSIPELVQANRRKMQRHDAKKFNITIEEYDRLHATPCEICGKLNSRMAIDHSHQTGKIRGSLCIGCNIGIGWLDKPDWLQKAMEYLKNKNGR